MSTVDSIQNPAGAALASARGRVDLMGDTQDRFLTLLITQLRNQDPLNPMDNEQITSQLAQLSTVQGIQQLNDTLLALSGQMDVSQSMQAANLIGKPVLVPGSKISLGSDPANPDVKVATPFGVDLMSTADKVTVNILNNGGSVVREIELDIREAGVYSFEWDGRDNTGQVLPDGAYNVEIKASLADAPVSAEALRYGVVDSVAYTTKGLRLDLGLAGDYSLLDIRKIM
ncbi:MAG TPA: flagellar hook assembly protein FlgD [Paenalcaligenes hominis]|uniref:Basal-body rod modification protein FlgD n=1 Tax=Paenalcaligenes hominis TaxID=643674 RepID=A0A1U9JX49_9BURK|nr:flagellar hook capping FlgD N-terminal domain-containing protein [Paenalcaligenes hominis]AQS50338.1 flagellar basal body rod modification protein [Paenalcaligenes hominis]NJB65973.1 flagellar basal-body rod modification protein FlgD [Paenalcaligenes hominis]GGE71130.1 basal-body rod modification protein FlgD [Paenalcaligenes hominis]HJH24612.1 flagellar hook assembly protein FlgD [Paenalcaligenes hominis]